MEDANESDDDTVEFEIELVTSSSSISLVDDDKCQSDDKEAKDLHAPQDHKPDEPPKDETNLEAENELICNPLDRGNRQSDKDESTDQSTSGQLGQVELFVCDDRAEEVGNDDVREVRTTNVPVGEEGPCQETGDAAPSIPTKELPPIHPQDDDEHEGSVAGEVYANEPATLNPDGDTETRQLSSANSSHSQPELSSIEEPPPVSPVPLPPPPSEVLDQADSAEELKLPADTTSNEHEVAECQSAAEHNDNHDRNHDILHEPTSGEAVACETDLDVIKQPIESQSVASKEPKEWSLVETTNEQQVESEEESGKAAAPAQNVTDAADDKRGATACAQINALIKRHDEVDLISRGTEEAQCEIDRDDDAAAKSDYELDLMQHQPVDISVELESVTQKALQPQVIILDETQTQTQAEHQTECSVCVDNSSRHSECFDSVSHSPVLSAIEADELQSHDWSSLVAAAADDEDELERELDEEPEFERREVSVKRHLNPRDEYSLGAELGRGKFGTVFRCTELSSGRQLAAKFIAMRRHEDREDVEREVAIMSVLQHRRLLQLYDAFDDGYQEMCLITELVEGGELFERIVDDDFDLTERKAAIFMRQICEGVEYMHSQQIVHLDMKPENILCLSRTSVRIKLIDFGLARRLDPNNPIRVMFGTPDFAAPEVLGYETVSLATDMWSVGVICYVLLSGLSPFMGDSDIDTMANVTRATYDFNDQAFEPISELAKDFIRKLLLRNPSERLPPRECLKHPWLQRSTGDTSHTGLTQLDMPVVRERRESFLMQQHHRLAMEQAAANAAAAASSSGVCNRANSITDTTPPLQFYHRPSFGGESTASSGLISLDKRRLKRYVVKRKWHKTVHAIMALNRMGAKLTGDYNK